jgi:purine nucleosidase/pyrimidine-specific ribonucleoside hydrolase
VVIDCDPGRDDALAILAALGCRDVHVDFISTVAGNVTAEQGASNALGILAVAGVDDVPVYLGAVGPLARDLVTGSTLHGDMADAEPAFPEHGSRVAGPAHSASRAWCRAPSGPPKRLVAIGPLTNVGRLLAEDPEGLAAVDDVFIMGGTVGRIATRVSPTAEFNFHSDPEAADLVIRSGARIWLFDYDATTACQIPTRAIAEIVAAIGAPVGTYVESWLRHLWEYANRVYGRGGIAVHDLYALAGAAGMMPGRWERYTIAVDAGDERRGTLDATPAPAGAGVAVARGLDVDAMIAFLSTSVSRSPGPD